MWSQVKTLKFSASSHSASFFGNLVLGPNEETHMLSRAGEEVAEAKVSVTRRWLNPIACRTPNDVYRNGQGHVKARSGWHSFWHAVQELEHVPRGGAADDGCPPGMDGALFETLMHCLAQNMQEYPLARDEFEQGGLLDPSGVEDEHDVRCQRNRAKFDQADAVLRHFSQRLTVIPPARKRSCDVKSPESPPSPPLFSSPTAAGSLDEQSIVVSLLKPDPDLLGEAIPSMFEPPDDAAAAGS